jgi:hypothetical protein
VGDGIAADVTGVAAAAVAKPRARGPGRSHAPQPAGGRLALSPLPLPVWLLPVRLQPVKPAPEQTAKIERHAGPARLPVIPLLTAKLLGPTVGQRVIEDVPFTLQSTGEGRDPPEMVTTTMKTVYRHPILWG